MDRGAKLNSPQFGLGWTQSPPPRGSIPFSALAGCAMPRASPQQEEHMDKDKQQVGALAAAVHARLERLLSRPAR
jgi:hypothetical protein